VDDETSVTQNRNSGNPDFVESVSVINVKRTVKAIKERSPILNEMLKTGQIGIAGGMHDISTGMVTFFNDTMDIKS